MRGLGSEVNGVDAAITSFKEDTLSLTSQVELAGCRRRSIFGTAGFGSRGGRVGISDSRNGQRTVAGL